MIRSMRKVALVAAMATAAAAQAACGGGGGVSSDVDDYITALASYADTLCGCFAEFGYNTKDECLADAFQAPTAAERDCIVAAYESDSTAADNLSCLLSVQATYNSCVASSLVCTDDTSLDDYDTQASAAAENCPALPAAVDTAVQDCFQ